VAAHLVLADVILSPASRLLGEDTVDREAV
jgi:hypothetical protein